MPERNLSHWSRLSPALRHTISRIPQSTLAVRMAHGRHSRHLRILAFHGVPDIGQFATLVRAIVSRYQPVGADAVADALHGGGQLPDHAVWFTFDDGLASTFQAGELLMNHGVRATAFVCPGCVGREGWLWFEAAITAARQGLVDSTDEPEFNLGVLKTVSDDERRRRVDVLVGRLARAGVQPPVASTLDDIDGWGVQGHDIGNHTWDHPCLDSCSAEVQRDQILKAHDAILGWGVQPHFFAYPNGNWTPESSEVLRQLGYAGSLLFDHRLATDLSDVHRLSRLRIDSDIDTRRAMSILSGAHSFAYHLGAGSHT